MKIKRLLSLVLVLSMLLQVSPVSAMATDENHIAPPVAEETVTTDEEPGETINAESEETEEASAETAADETASADEPDVVGEVTELREEYVKHFRNSDGSFTAVGYNSPVHYKETEDGDWKEIDNTLSLKTTKDGSKTVTEYAPKDSPMNVRFAKETGGNLATMESQGHTLSWYYEFGSKARSVSDPITAKKMDKAELAPTEQEQDKRKEKFRADKISDGLRYSEIMEDVDLEYILSSASLKENLILQSKNAPSGYTIVYEIGELTAEQTSTQEITLKDNAGEIIFVISAPCMVDANMEESTDVSLTLLSQGNGNMRVRLNANEEWLQAEERAYPVTIDPYIVKEMKVSSYNGYASYIQYDAGYGYDSGGLLVGNDNYTYYGDAQSYIKFPLPTLLSGDIVVGSKMHLYQMAGDDGYSTGDITSSLQVNVYRVKSSWTRQELIDSAKMEGLPSRDTTVIDYKMIRQKSSGGYVTFDITEVVKMWYNGTDNYGICLRANDTTQNDRARFMANQNDVDPCLEVTYLNNKGLEGRWTTHNQDLGESGMGYVNDYTGNLVFIAPLTGTTGNRMPVSLSLVYNGYQHGDDVDRPYTVGKGWRLNIHEKITPITGSTSDLMAELYTNGYRYIYEDADGTTHYLIKDETTQIISDEEGLGLTLTINSTVTDMEKYVLTSDDGGKKTFTSSGYLRKIYDDNGNYAKLFYSDVEGESGQVTEIEDGSGRGIIIGRTNGVVTSITDPAGRVTDLIYESGLLKKIVYPDDISTYFFYTDSGLRLNYITSRDGRRLTYSYKNTGYEASTSRVWKITEYSSAGDSISSDNQGNSLTIDYAKLNQTTFTDNKERTEVYQFDNYGRTVAIRDAAGNVGQYTYQSGETISKKANTLTSATVAPQYVGNLLLNHSFEQGTDEWSAYNGTISTSTEKHYLGAKSLCLQDGADAIQKYTPSGSTYTFSAYVRTGTSTVCPKLSVWFFNAEGYMGDSYCLNSETMAYATNSWNRIHITFSMPEGATWFKVCCATTGEGTAYFDCVQLENRSTVNPYNMLENGGFDRTDSSVWGGYDTTSSDIVKFVGSDGYYKIYGSASARKRVVQTIYVNRTANKTFFNLRATAAGNSVPLSDDSRKFALSLTAVYTDGTESSTKYVNFNPDYDGTQVAAGTIGFNSSKTIKKVYVRCEYANNANSVWFDNVQVTIDESGSSYTYDDDGNLITAKDNAARNQTYTYNSVGEVLTAKDAENKQYTFNYDNTNKHRLVSAVSNSADIKFSFAYDDYGNVQVQRVQGVDDDGNTTGKYIRQVTYYTDNGNYPSTVYTDRGYATTYTYNTSKGTLASSSVSPDGLDYYTLNYTYDSDNDRLTAVTDGPSTVEYTYNIRGRLTTVKTNSTTYTFGYNGFGNNTSVKAGGSTLVNNTYNANNGTLSKVTYGNGDYTNYYYDSLDRVTYVDYNGYTKHTFAYNANGQVGRYKDYVSGKTYDYTYDGIGRLIRTNVSDGSRIRAYYNTMDQLSEIHYRFADNGGKDVFYTYSTKDNQPLTVSFGSDSAYKVTNGYDSLRRLYYKTMVTPSEDVANVSVSYGYLDWSSEENRTTSTVKGIDYSYVSGGLSIHDPYYSYDRTGNILTERVWVSGDTTGDLKEKYTYSTSGQLTRHDSATQNKSFTYSYDEAGNLLTKRTYAYTTGTLGSSTDSVTYAYSTGTWGDLLTAYDGKSITYDEMGNMKTFDGATFTWQGRQLTSRAKNGTTTTYKYNSDGIRTSKTVGSTKTEYFLNGSQILAQKAGDNVMWFFYDANGTRVGLISNGYMFYYLYNLQGDVIALVRASTGQIVAKYTYDAWGKCTTTNLDGWTVGTRNPFRYRGYYYDSESGLYYLNSRYYDPELGRFISPDVPEALAVDCEDLVQYNLYAYCFNNPINMSDDCGTWPSWGTKAIIGTVATAAAIAVTVATGGAAAPVLIGVATSTISGAAIGYATGGKQGAIDGAASGLMWGGIGAFASSAVAAVKFIGSAKGAVSGTQKLTKLKPGTELDRYGSLNGRYLTNAGTNVDQLALPSSNTQVKTSLQVTKTLTTVSGEIAPNFGGQGGGWQYYTRYSIGALIKMGYLTIK